MHYGKGQGRRPASLAKHPARFAAKIAGCAGSSPLSKPLSLRGLDRHL
jgi:hypothetical protein